jgi:tRNA (adenine-N(1)-)-methyltransferase non-catalytic subunit
LVSGNTGFDGKTSFAQQKYVRKKARKHSDRILVLRPTIRLLADSYHKRDPERVAHLRFHPIFSIFTKKKL